MMSGERVRSSAWDIAISVLISVCVIVAIYEARVIIVNRRADEAAVNEYVELRGYVQERQEDDTAAAAEEVQTAQAEAVTETVEADGQEEEPLQGVPSDVPALSIDYQALSELNPDFVGWLYVPAVDLSYPVVQETFADQYLNTTFEGVPNSAGCLFMDDVSDPDFAGFYDFIFGHNMKNGTMFGALRQIHQAGNEHLVQDEPYLYIYRADTVMRYRIYAYYITENGSPAYDEIYDHEAYDRVLDYTISNSMIGEPDRALFDGYPEILTLSTCSGRSGGSQRFVVHSVKVDTWLNDL